jgi:FlaA1/EpsC-like NDP-sugar epimerase
MPGRIILRLPANAKIAVAVLADVLVLAACVPAAFLLRLGELVPPWQPLVWLMLASALGGPLLLWITGTYREVTRYVGPVFALRVAQGCVLAGLLLIAVTWILGRGEGVPRTVPAIFALLALIGVGGLRLAARWLLLGQPTYTRDQRIAIFGAGAAGIGLHAALVHGRSHQIVSYFDDDVRMVGRQIRGVPVIAASRLRQAVADLGIRTVLLALPSAGRQRRREIVEELASLGVSVLTVPTLAEIADGSARVDQLRPVRIEELLGRPPVESRQDLLHRLIEGRSVLVTGAGGSIGSELSRRILSLRPDRLVILDASELALYTIETELRERMSRDHSVVRLEAVLGSVTDPVRMEQVCRAHRVQTIYHAAAYKHVPMVERNESEGVETNVFGTLVMVEAAQRADVEHFILVSTDKAVRPTSVMGASKRLAEMVLQAAQARPGHRMKLSMVRFGNVLGSSGSVIPLFREQIDRGGPVTVTDPRMVRYFMTIPEACDLVIQAGAMARGGEVFLLDMGDPVRIDDLARNMIRLSGRTVRDASNPSGDVEIRYLGIRPGEKLFEELLIEGTTMPTAHASIRVAIEPMLTWSELDVRLQRLRAAVDQRNDALIREQLTDLVRHGGSMNTDLTASRRL